MMGHGRWFRKRRVGWAWWQSGWMWFGILSFVCSMCFVRWALWQMDMARDMRRQEISQAIDLGLVEWEMMPRTARQRALRWVLPDGSKVTFDGEGKWLHP